MKSTIFQVALIVASLQGFGHAKWLPNACKLAGTHARANESSQDPMPYEGVVGAMAVSYDAAYQEGKESSVSYKPCFDDQLNEMCYCGLPPTLYQECGYILNAFTDGIMENSCDNFKLYDTCVLKAACYCSRDRPAYWRPERRRWKSSPDSDRLEAGFFTR